MVAKAWSRGRGDCVGRLAMVGENSDSWGKEDFGDIAGKVADLRVKLQSLQREVQTEPIQSETMAAEGELGALLEQEEII